MNEWISSHVPWRRARRLPSQGPGYPRVVPTDSADPLSHLHPGSQLASSSLHRDRVAEGNRDIAPDPPVEYNVDYLNGVSFHKGCYIGQELEARTHHAEIVRKEILPLEII